MRDSLVGWDAFTNDDGTPAPKAVPDNALPILQQVGNLIRPRQSWFPTDSWRDTKRPNLGARESFVDTFNDILSRDAYAQIWFNWHDVFDAGEDLPDASRYTTTAVDITDLLLMVEPSLNALQVGENVLIEHTKQANGHWTLWQCIENNGKRTFILVDFQKWNMKEGLVWDTMDWFDTNGWSPTDSPVFASRIYKSATPHVQVTSSQSRVHWFR
jgi:hypothetical protein